MESTPSTEITIDAVREGISSAEKLSTSIDYKPPLKSEGATRVSRSSSTPPSIRHSLNTNQNSESKDARKGLPCRSFCLPCHHQRRSLSLSCLERQNSSASLSVKTEKKCSLTVTSDVLSSSGIRTRGRSQSKESTQSKGKKVFKSTSSRLKQPTSSSVFTSAFTTVSSSASLSKTNTTSTSKGRKSSLPTAVSKESVNSSQTTSTVICSSSQGSKLPLLKNRPLIQRRNTTDVLTLREAEDNPPSVSLSLRSTSIPQASSRKTPKSYSIEENEDDSKPESTIKLISRHDHSPERITEKDPHVVLYEQNDNETHEDIKAQSKEKTTVDSTMLLGMEMRQGKLTVEKSITSSSSSSSSVSSAGENTVNEDTKNATPVTITLPEGRSPNTSSGSMIKLRKHHLSDITGKRPSLRLPLLGFSSGNKDEEDTRDLEEQQDSLSDAEVTCRSRDRDDSSSTTISAAGNSSPSGIRTSNSASTLDTPPLDELSEERRANSSSSLDNAKHLRPPLHPKKQGNTQEEATGTPTINFSHSSNHSSSSGYASPSSSAAGVNTASPTPPSSTVKSPSLTPSYAYAYAPASKRYLKRRLRGPYGEMLEEEMRKSKDGNVYDHNMRFLRTHSSNPASTSSSGTGFCEDLSFLQALIEEAKSRQRRKESQSKQHQASSPSIIPQTDDQQQQQAIPASLGQLKSGSFDLKDPLKETCTATTIHPGHPRKGSNPEYFSSPSSRSSIGSSFAAIATTATAGGIAVPVPHFVPGATTAKCLVKFVDISKFPHLMVSVILFNSFVIFVAN